MLINTDLSKKYFNVTTDPSRRMWHWFLSGVRTADRDMIRDDVAVQGNGYVPISLQYGTYTANGARTQSIAAGDPAEPEVKNRSYNNKSVTATNQNDLQSILDTSKAMNGKPVIVCMAFPNRLLSGNLKPGQCNCSGLWRAKPGHPGYSDRRSRAFRVITHSDARQYENRGSAI